METVDNTKTVLPKTVNGTRTGKLFEFAVRDYIKSWNIEDIEIVKEQVAIGDRSKYFADGKKHIKRTDILVKNKKNGVGVSIECKYQYGKGTAWQKIDYEVNDIHRFDCPYIRMLCLAGDGIPEGYKNILKSETECQTLEFMLDKDTKQPIYLADPGMEFKERVLELLGLLGGEEETMNIPFTA